MSKRTVSTKISSNSEVKAGDTRYLESGEIRYLESTHGYRVLAIPSEPAFTSLSDAIWALKQYRENGMQFPSVYDLLTGKAPQTQHPVHDTDDAP